eukprot:8950159-Lingulodinium_polyedra.AAC.1
MADWAYDRWPGGEGRARRAFRSKTALLTYQGNRGVVSPEAYKPLLCPETTCAQLRSCPYMQTLWQDTRAYVTHFCTQLFVDIW